MFKRVIYGDPFALHLQIREKRIACGRVSEELTSSFQKKITSAQLKDDSVVVRRHMIVCPYCGRETPAYAAYLTQGGAGAVPVKLRKEIERWALRQTSLWGDALPDLLQFNIPESETGSFIYSYRKKSSGKGAGWANSGQEVLHSLSVSSREEQEEICKKHHETPY